MEPLRERLVVWMVALAAVALLGSGLSLGALALVPYATIQRASTDLSPAHFHQIVRRALILSPLLIAAGILAVACRQRVAAGISQAFADAAQWARNRELFLPRNSAESGRIDFHGIGLATIVVVGIAVRVAYLRQPVRYDEAVTYLAFASRPLWIAIADYTYPNNHILHTLLVKVSVGLFGARLWAIRLPAMVAGVLLIPATYLSTRAWYDKHAALVAAAIVAASPPLVLYSTNARGYSLIALCFVLMLWIARDVVDSNGRGPLLPIVLLGVTGLWVNPTMVYPFAIVVAWIAVFLMRQQPARTSTRTLLPLVVATAAALACTALLYVPVLLHSGPYLLLANRFVAPLSWAEFLPGVRDGARAVYLEWTGAWTAAVTIVLGAGLVGAWLRHRKQGDPQPLAVGVAVLVVLVCLQRVVPYPRVLLCLLPALAGVSAGGLVYLASSMSFASARSSVTRFGVPVVALLVCVALASATVRSGWVSRSEETGRCDGASAVADYLEATLNASAHVVVVPPASAPIRFYMEQHGWNDRGLVSDAGALHDGALYVIVTRDATDMPQPHVDATSGPVFTASDVDVYRTR